MRNETLVPGDEWWPVETPLGNMVICGCEGSIHQLFLPGDKMRSSFPEQKRGKPASLASAAEQLAAYFAGDLTSFDLPLHPTGTEWQKRVWQALLDIGFGETATYGEVAKAVGNPRASRAVGMASGRNPIAVIIPCHRVIGSDGTLTGYGGGIDMKAKLLAHERSVLSGRANRLGSPQLAPRSHSSTARITPIGPSAELSGP
jgi:methylated-DNA-[protein]-cysteine S-methyltransferase